MSDIVVDPHGVEIGIICTSVTGIATLYNRCDFQCCPPVVVTRTTRNILTGNVVRIENSAFSNVKSSKASGPDVIPCRVLKQTAHETAPILADIFNCSLSTGILPRDWKSANMVFEKGNTNLAENYRPISLTCVCCKILEHIVCHSIRDHLDNNAILSAFQHGFQSGLQNTNTNKNLYSAKFIDKTRQ